MKVQHLYLLLAIGGKIKVVEYILSCGRQVNLVSKNKDGKTSKDIARERKRWRYRK